MATSLPFILSTQQVNMNMRLQNDLTTAYDYIVIILTAIYYIIRYLRATFTVYLLTVIIGYYFACELKKIIMRSIMSIMHAVIRVENKQ